MIRPRFKSWYHVEIIEPEGVYLVSERGKVMLKGRAACLVAAAMDGQRSHDDIVDKLAGSLSAAEVYFHLDQLEAMDYLEDAADNVPAALSAYLNAIGVPPAEGAARIAGAKVAVRALGGLDTARLARTLADQGLMLAEVDADVTVLLVEDYCLDALHQINGAALAQHRPWMLVKPVGQILWIGPIFVPGKTGCWACLAQRVWSNREVDRYLVARTGRKEPLPSSRASLA